MPNLYITATKKDGPDPDYRIDAYKIDHMWRDIDYVLTYMRADWFVFTMPPPGSSPARVYAHQHWRTKRWYLSTAPDGIGPNNLLNLPDN